MAVMETEKVLSNCFKQVSKNIFAQNIFLFLV